MKAEALIDHSLRLLQGAIRASGLTQTEIDERIGRRRGYLSHVFQRRVDLKVEDLLAILAVIRLDPRRFFVAATGGDQGVGGGVLQLIAERLEPADPPPLNPDVEERVKSIVKGILDEVKRSSAA